MSLTEQEESYIVGYTAVIDFYMYVYILTDKPALINS